MNKPNAPNFQRKGLEHTLIDHSDYSEYSGFDDMVVFNTQCSSQWDGLRHHSFNANKMFYNGVKKSEIKGGGLALGIQSTATLLLDGRSAANVSQSGANEVASSAAEF